MVFPGNAPEFRGSFHRATAVTWRGTMHNPWTQNDGWSVLFQDLSHWAIAADTSVDPTHGTYGIAVTPVWCVRNGASLYRVWRLRGPLTPEPGTRTTSTGVLLRVITGG